jgi:hypothetical protein
MDTHLKAPICIQTLENAILAYPELKGAAIHSDRVIQYTSMAYRKAISKYRPHQQSQNLIYRGLSAIGIITRYLHPMDVIHPQSNDINTNILCIKPHSL